MEQQIQRPRGKNKFNKFIEDREDEYPQVKRARGRGGEVGGKVGTGR